jgi:hypothetical protein
MKVFVVNDLRLRQRWFIFEFGVLLIGLFQFLVLLVVRNDKLLLIHVQGFTKFNGDFLLFLENEFVILHVFFGVSFQV